MKITEINAPVQPDTYEASMFLKQSIRAGKYAIKIHDLLTNDQEVESWVQKKIDLATSYISTVGHYLEGEHMNEDAGEGHMAKSQLYAAAKYCIKITTMVRPGDDIEAWVQTKMNKAVDYLDAVYHYEDYQRLNPYREDLGDTHVRHAEIVKKNIDEILETETDIDDIETKPGMLNILKKRVHEVEKKMSKQMKERELSKGEQKKKEKYVKGMKKNKSGFKDRYGDDAEAVMYATATKMAKEQHTPFKQQIINKLKKPADDYLAKKQGGEYLKKLQQKLQDKLTDKYAV